ncbi:protein ABHD15 [Lissotriton helveticus]
MPGGSWDAWHLLLTLQRWIVKLLCVGRSILCGLLGSGTLKHEAGEGEDGDVFIHDNEGFPCGCRLICKPSALANCLLKVLRRFSDPDVACWLWRKWAHVQTIYHLLLPGDRRLESARDHLQLPDGGIVALDWVVGPWTTLKHRRATNSVTSPPVLLVIPNAFGKITRNVQDFCLQALEQGFYPVIFNRRGQNGCPLTTLKLQQFGDPADLTEAVAYIRYRHPSSALFAMSEGLGSGLLLSYLGECGSSSYLTAAACISPVLRCQEWFEAGLPWLYRWALVIQQKMSLSRYATALHEDVDMTNLLRCKSLRELEELLFCKTKNNPISWDTYWERNEPLRDVDEVAVPVLCICSADDPIRGSPESTLPTELFKSNPYLFLLLTEHGGHCGFLKDAPPAWSHEVTLEYFRSVAEFFRAEERMRGFSWRRSSFALYRHRKGTLQKRDSAASLDIQDMFSWKRSYTR